MVDSFLKAIAAGVCIALAAQFVLKEKNKVLSAFLFSSALFTICGLGLKLVTGAVGYCSGSPQSIVENIIILWGNCIGVLGASCFLPHPDLPPIEKPLNTLLCDSISCGAIIFLAVELFHRGYWQGILLLIPLFVLSGFEHSIANFYYFCRGIKSLKFVLTSLLGNIIGAVLLRLLVL